MHRISLILTLLVAATVAFSQDAPRKRAQEALNNGIVAATREQNLPKAAAYFRDSLLADPSFEEASADLALVLELMDKLDEAKAILVQLTNSRDIKIKSFATTAITRIDQIKKADSTPEGRTTRQFNMCLARSQSFLKFGDLKSALAQCIAASQLIPGRHEPYVQACEVAVLADDFDSAIGFIDKALESAPADVALILKIERPNLVFERTVSKKRREAMAAVKSGQWDLAEQLLQQYLTVRDEPSVRLTLAGVQLTRGAMDAARATLSSIQNSEDNTIASSAKTMLQQIAVFADFSGAMKEKANLDEVYTIESVMERIGNEIGVTLKSAESYDKMAQDLESQRVNAQLEGNSDGAMVGALGALIGQANANNERKRVDRKKGRLKELSNLRARYKQAPQEEVAARSLFQQKNFKAAALAFQLATTKPNHSPSFGFYYSSTLALLGDPRAVEVFQPPVSEPSLLDMNITYALSKYFAVRGEYALVSSIVFSNYESFVSIAKDKSAPRQQVGTLMVWSAVGMASSSKNVDWVKELIGHAKRCSRHEAAYAMALLQFRKGDFRAAADQMNFLNDKQFVPASAAIPASKLWAFQAECYSKAGNKPKATSAAMMALAAGAEPTDQLKQLAGGK